jgi:hypothetical protein
MAIMTIHASIRTCLAVMILLFCSTVCVRAVDCYTEIDPYYWTIDVPSLIHISSPADVEEIRTNINNYFWPDGGFPSDKMPASVTTLSQPDGTWPDPDSISFPTDGLVGHWEFDGDYTDSSGSGNDATSTGPVTVGTDNGLIGGAAVFVGTDYITLSTSALSGSDWTFMCWVKGAPANDGMFLASGYAYYTGGVQGWESVFLRYFSGGDVITGAVNWPEWDATSRVSGEAGHTGEWPIAIDVWHHVALSYEGATNTMKFNLDGKLKCQNNPTFPGWQNDSLTLGGSFGVQGLIYDYAGLMDDFRLYSRVVSAEEIVIPEPPLVIPSWINTIGSDNLGQVDRIDIAMDYQMHSYAYHLHPKNDSVNRLLIFQMGHSDDILTAGGRETIKYFLDKGFDVVTFWMPVFGENTRTAYDIPVYDTYTFSTGTGGHDEMGAVLENSDGSFIRFFVEPVFVVINYAKSQYDYRDINMTGVSGGGWTTHVCAAMDPRIELNFPVAGSLPIYLREGPCPNGSAGDAEQVWPALFEEIASWLDVYILGGYGDGRGQIHILNQYDACCFWGVNYETFEPYVTEAVNDLGAGYYYVYLDSSHSEHKISDPAIEQVIYPAVDEHLRIKGDLNGDDIVNLLDLAILSANWMRCSYTNDDCP